MNAPVMTSVDGWVVTTEGHRLLLRQSHATIVVAVHQLASAPVDPRGVAARLAAGVSARWPAAAVEFRSFGTLAGRNVAMQVVGEGEKVQLHAVSGVGSAERPLLVAIATCRRDAVDEVGAVFARVAAEARVEAADA